MAYVVQRVYFNGYRCSCCYQTWESTKIVSTLEEALEAIPLENKGQGDIALESVKVTDGATGEMIAWGQLLYPKFGRYSGYKATRWLGWRENKRFDSAGSDEQWKTELAVIQKNIHQKELDAAQAALVAAQEKMKQLQETQA